MPNTPLVLFLPTGRNPTGRNHLILFAKAIVPGGAGSDLFPETVAVKPYVRGGKTVQGHTQHYQKKSVSADLPIAKPVPVADISSVEAPITGAHQESPKMPLSLADLRAAKPLITRISGFGHPISVAIGLADNGRTTYVVSGSGKNPTHSDTISELPDQSKLGVWKNQSVVDAMSAGYTHYAGVLLGDFVPLTTGEAIDLKSQMDGAQTIGKQVAEEYQAKKLAEQEKAIKDSIVVQRVDKKDGGLITIGVIKGTNSTNVPAFQVRKNGKLIGAGTHMYDIDTCAKQAWTKNLVPALKSGGYTYALMLDKGCVGITTEEHDRLAPRMKEELERFHNEPKRQKLSLFEKRKSLTSDLSGWRESAWRAHDKYIADDMLGKPPYDYAKEIAEAESKLAEFDRAHPSIKDEMAAEKSEAARRRALYD